MGPRVVKNEAHNGTLPEDPAAVREQLERILASAEFCHSKRHSGFLRYVVEEVLSGDVGQLKERIVGVKVFGLDPAYDTSSHPAVRVSAGELRKRLLRYYDAPGRGSELRIDLPPGSYVPEFSFAPVAAPEPILAPPSRGLRRRFVYIAAAVAAVAIFGLALWLVNPWAAQDVFERFWSPVWEAPGQALVVVAAGSQNDRDGRPAPQRMDLDDAIALASLTPVLQGHGKDFRILSTASLADMKQGPAVLIAAFGNALSMRLMGEARFNFEIDEKTNLPCIRDRQNPSSNQWRLERPPDEAAAGFTDYAIVSRVRDPATGRLAVVAGGITARGTRAVAEFLASARAMASISRLSGKEWRGKNVQIVLTIPFTPAGAGTPSVLTAYSW